MWSPARIVSDEHSSLNRNHNNTKVTLTKVNDDRSRLRLGLNTGRVRVERIYQEDIEEDAGARLLWPPPSPATAPR